VKPIQIKFTHQIVCEFLYNCAACISTHIMTSILKRLKATGQHLHLATVVLAFVMTTVSGHPGHMVLKFYQTSTVSPIDLTLYNDNLSNQQFTKRLPNCFGWNKRRCDQVHLEDYIRKQTAGGRALPADIQRAIHSKYPHMRASSAGVASSPFFITSLLMVAVFFNSKVSNQ